MRGKKSNYRITENHIDSRNGIEKLERDGFSRYEITKAIHESLTGASRKESRDVAEKLYDRQYGKK